MPVRLHFIRHGQTAWSLSGRHTGTTDLALDPQGLVEAGALAGRLGGLQFSHVLTSPRLRARQTCELAGLAAQARCEPDLAEWDYGDYEGLTTPEIVGQRDGWDLFRHGCPNGDSPDQVTARADRLIMALILLDGDVALFSHAQFGCVLAARWIGLPLDTARHFELSTASVSVLGYDSHHPDVARIIGWNSVPDAPLTSATPAATGDGPGVTRRAIEKWENEGGEIPSVARLQPSAA